MASTFTQFEIVSGLRPRKDNFFIVFTICDINRLFKEVEGDME